MRVFIALDIDEVIRERIALFVEGVHGVAPDVRWVKPESLHVTLKFIGEQTEPNVEHIKQTLSTITGSTGEIQFRGYGFFPTSKSPRVFWIGLESGPQLPAFATAIDAKMASLGIPKEDRAFSPHLTLARGAGSSGSPRWHKGDAFNRTFLHLQEKLSSRPTPEFGTMIWRQMGLQLAE